MPKSFSECTSSSKWISFSWHWRQQGCCPFWKWSCYWRTENILEQLSQDSRGINKGWQTSASWKIIWEQIMIIIKDKESASSLSCKKVLIRATKTKLWTLLMSQYSFKLWSTFYQCTLIFMHVSCRALSVFQCFFFPFFCRNGMLLKSQTLSACSGVQPIWCSRKYQLWIYGKHWTWFQIREI